MGGGRTRPERSTGRTTRQQGARSRRSPPTSRPSRSPRSRGRLRLALPVLVVFVEALAGLHAQVTRQDHALEKRRWSPRRIPELVKERVRDVQVDVETGVVDELEGTHRVPP